MTAKEMFEKLGFKLKSNNKQYLTYEKDKLKKIIRNGEETHIIIKEIIVFDKYEKRVGGSIKGFPKKYWFDSKTIPAINKQVEELGWNNE